MQYGKLKKSQQNRDCLPEIATGAKRPRNDKSGSLAALKLPRPKWAAAWETISAIWHGAEQPLRLGVEQAEAAVAAGQDADLHRG